MSTAQRVLLLFVIYFRYVCLVCCEMFAFCWKFIILVLLAGFLSQVFCDASAERQ